MAALLYAMEFNQPSFPVGSIGSGTIELVSSIWYLNGNGNALGGAGMPQPNGCDFVEMSCAVSVNSANWAWGKMNNNNPADNGYNNNGIGWGYRGDGHIFVFGTSTSEIPTGEIVVPTSVWSDGTTVGQRGLKIGIHDLGGGMMDLYVNGMQIKRAYGLTGSVGSNICWGSYNGAFSGFDYVRAYQGNPYFAQATLLD